MPANNEAGGLEIKKLRMKNQSGAWEKQLALQPSAQTFGIWPPGFFGWGEVGYFAHHIVNQPFVNFLLACFIGNL